MKKSNRKSQKMKKTLNEINDGEDGKDEKRRTRVRPKLLRTGKPGRPKKVYQSNLAVQDPKSVSEALSTKEQQA